MQYDKLYDTTHPTQNEHDPRARGKFSDGNNFDADPFPSTTRAAQYPRSHPTPSSEPSSPRAQDQGAAQRHTAPGIAGESTTIVATCSEKAIDRAIARHFGVGWQRREGKPLPVVSGYKRKDKSNCYVYGIRRPDTRAIKIGKAWDVDVRLCQLQTANDVELELLFHFIGSDAIEKFILEMLAPWRIRGEWFAPSPEVEDWIARQSRQARSAA